MKFWKLAIVGLLTLVQIGAFAAAQDEHEGHDDDGGHDQHGPHDGELLEIGNEVAHVEFVHDAEKGVVTLYVLQADAKSSRKADRSPKLKILTADGPKVLELQPIKDVEGGFSVSSEHLKTEKLVGRIDVAIDGKSYAPDIPEADHDDEHDDEEGHDKDDGHDNHDKHDGE